MTRAAAAEDSPGGDSGELPGPRTLPVPAAFPLAIVRPLTRRRHVRVPGATAGGTERLAWHEPAAEPAVAAVTAVSVVPGPSRPRHGHGSLPRPAFEPLAGFVVLDDVLGEEEAGCAPGRHRDEPRVWQFLRRVPGWRPSPPARDEPEPDQPTPVAEIPAPDTDVTGPDGDRAAPADHATPADDVAPDIADLGDTQELEPVAPLVRPYVPLVPALAARRRRREPVPAVRGPLVAAQGRINAAAGAAAVARVAAQEAADLTDADVAAVVLRAVEGPRLLWLHPGGPGSGELWGPATLAALLGLGHPVRRVVEGDPLAGGAATALLAVPMPSGGSITGSLLVRRHTARAFSAAEQDVLSRLARMTGAALAGAAPVATAEAGPRTDTVTGWPGPRGFSADTGAAVRTADRHALPVSVVAAHLEGLARVRADLGQEPADGILRTLALALSEVLRVGDVAYRIGEDEFALLLPATGDDALPAVRSRLRDVVTDVLTAVDLPGTPRQVTLRTAQVPLDAVRQGTDAVDAALGAVGVPAQRVRWSIA